MSNVPSKASDELVKLVGAFESQIKQALPKHLTPSRMTRVIITEVRKNPKLALCDRASFFGSVITCAQLGLEPGSGLGQVYLIPYGKEVQMIIGYQGMIELAERSGQVTVDAHVVYEKDTFEYSLGIEGAIKHVPYMGTDDPGKVVASYAVAKYKDGRYKFRVCPLHEINKAKASSKSSGNGPWVSHFSEMARKTAVRRLFKLLPKSPEIAQAMDLEERLEMSETQGMSGTFFEFKKEQGITDTQYETIAVEPRKEELFSLVDEAQYNRVKESLRKLGIPETHLLGVMESMEGKDIQTELKRVLEVDVKRIIAEKAAGNE